MLGHHPLLERELRNKGRRAFAKILESHRTHFSETIGNDAVVADTQILYKLKLQIEPEGEAPFDAELEALFPQLSPPRPSAHLALVVLYDPSDHSRVVLDRSEEGYEELDALLSKQRADERVSRMRERGQGVWADRYEAAHDSLAEYVKNDDPTTDPDERAKQFQAEKAKMRAIMAGDAQERVAQIRELQRTDNLSNDPQERAQQLEERRPQIKQIATALSTPTVLAGGQPVASGAPDSTAIVDALSKLADLRDRGALTDAEFQAQKQKLLGG